MAANPIAALVTRILDGTAPLQAKAAAARGALPIPRADLVRIFVFLLKDDDEAIRNDATTSLAGLDDDTLTEILDSEECAPEVLTYFSRTAVTDGNGTAAAQIAYHPSAPAEALEILAGSTDHEILALVLTNQDRLLATPGLIDRLLANPALRAEQRSWIEETRSRAERQAEAEKELPATDEAVEPEEEEITIEDVARILNVDIGELMTASEIAGGEEFLQVDVSEEIRGAFQRIMTLNTSQKAILAIKGGREERMILIRDTNRLVALAVLKNPRMPEGEVEAIAGMRNVREEVLRTIGASREWTKNYGVALSLVRNPRTPPGISTNFISRLNNRDLKFLLKDKNVPEIIRRMAKKNHDLRQQRSKVSFKKH
jgi:hypothetical protein